jgi:hypothetical protein
VRRLLEHQPIFIGFKMDTSLSRQLDALEGSNRQYVSTDSSDFLRIVTLGKDRYVGKLIHERLTTERIDDVKRNVLTMLARLCPETRFPEKLEVLACGAEEEEPGDSLEPQGRSW